MNQARGPVGDDVRGGAALLDDPVDPRASGRSCCRHSPTALNSRISASSAFLPLPWLRRGVRLEPAERDVDVLRRQRRDLDVVPVAGVVEQRGVEALEQPVLDHELLAADPRSSAGVPRKTISPAISSRSAASAIAAPTPEAAIVLWPQPWPSPGRASYSARTPIRGAAAPRPPAQTGRARPSRAGRPDARPRSRGARSVSAIQPRRLVLLERRLRVGVDPMGQVEDLVAGGLDGGGEAPLGVGVRLGGAWSRRRGRGLWDDGHLPPGRRRQRSAESVASATTPSRG